MKHFWFIIVILIYYKRAQEGVTTIPSDQDVVKTTPPAQKGVTMTLPAQDGVTTTPTKKKEKEKNIPAIMETKCHKMF